MYEAYHDFGLTSSEIRTLSRMEMKRDYFYKCACGGATRTFSLELGALALIGTPDHGMPDRLKREHPEAGYEFCADILREKGIKYDRYMKRLR